MRCLKRITAAAITLAVAVTPVFAATLDRGKPTNFVIWAFLTSCTLIIVAQVLQIKKTAVKVLANKQQMSTH